VKDRAPWPPPGSASPLQKRGTSRTWYTPDTRDFIRLLRYRAQAGGIYAIIGDHDRADILVRSLDEKPDRWIRAYTYPKIGLRAMHESGLLSMAEVMAIPDFDPLTLEGTEADRRRFGELPEFWKIEVPDDGTPVRYPNKRPYRGRR
jgi:hypothetical protein